ECGDGGHGFSNANFGWVRLRKVSYKADFAAKCSIGQSGLQAAFRRRDAPIPTSWCWSTQTADSGHSPSIGSMAASRPHIGRLVPYASFPEADIGSATLVGN
ncbi:hypothetical protein, partial [Roseibium aggregatum]|uniref:hypothetical protein n=1 Tax=Roseibium aggregatum TaxID=187304 RepID=UPI001A8E4F47